MLSRCTFHLLAVLSTVGAMAQPSPDIVWSEKTHSYFVSPVAISPDGVLVASSGTNNSIRLARLTDGSPVRFLVGHTNGVASVAFSSDGSLLASTADNRTLRLWNVATGSLLRTIFLGGGNRQFSVVAFHPNGQYVASDRYLTNAALYSVSDGTPVWETLGCSSQIQSIAFSPDGSLVAIAGGIRGLDTRIRILRATDGELLQTLITSNSYGVRQLAFSPDGQWLVAGSYESTFFAGGVEIWRVSDWTQVRRLPVTAPTLAFLPDGRSLITLRDKTMDFWSFPEGTRLRSFGISESGNYGLHYSIAVSPRGDRFITGNYKQIATPNGTVTESATTAFRVPVVLRIGRQPGNLVTFDWTGDYSRFQVQRRSIDGENWANYGEPTSNRSVKLTTDGSGALFRVIAVEP